MVVLTFRLHVKLLSNINARNSINLIIKMEVTRKIPYAGGFAMIASALKGTPESRSGSLQAGNRELIISFI